MGALFLIIVIIVLLDSVQRMAASEITDTALQNDAVEALFIAESGLERAGWRYSTGSACTALAGETDTIGRGSFQVLASALVGTLCRVRVAGSVVTTSAANTVRRTVQAELTPGSQPGNGWAVGKKDGGANLNHWDGSSWSAVSAPLVPDEHLNGAHCVSSSDCWAVGDDKNGELIIHWDGSSWSRVGPYGGIPDEKLNSVHCASSSDCWAVGDDKNGELIIHWDGSSWSRVGPYGGIPNEKLHSVHCVSSSDCWAVGDDKNGELIIHWDGSSWSRVGPYGGIPNKKLYSVHCVSSNDCWAVGEKNGGAANINHWDGSSWSAVSAPSVPDEHLNGISMVSATEGYLVGDDGTLAVWDGSSWSAQTSPSSKDLYAISVATGSSGTVKMVKWTEVIQ
jgi:hypothetical protein